MKSIRISIYTILIGLSIIGMLLVGIVFFRYAYSLVSMIESGAGLIILLVIAGLLWFYRKRTKRAGNSTERSSSIFFGLILGLLWMIEISINNFIAPPLPARDIIDNIFLAVIAISILVFSVMHAFTNDHLMDGIKAGIWSGFVSGLIAYCMGLLFIVFGMRFIIQDPINVAEWVNRGANITAPNALDYFAFETFAGAFGHLIVFGIAMGGILGVLGGSIGKVIKRIG